MFDGAVTRLCRRRALAFVSPFRRPFVAHQSSGDACGRCLACDRPPRGGLACSTALPPFPPPHPLGPRKNGCFFSIRLIVGRMLLVVRACWPEIPPHAAGIPSTLGFPPPPACGVKRVSMLHCGRAPFSAVVGADIYPSMPRAAGTTGFSLPLFPGTHGSHPRGSEAP